MAIISIVAAAMAAFVVGAIYYGAFAKSWMKAAQIHEDDAHMSVMLFVISFICALVISAVMAFSLSALEALSLTGGLMWGVIFWLGFCATTLIVNHRYQRKSISLTLIDGGHWLLVFLTIGAINGVFYSS